MAFARLGRAATLLLVLWLTADVAAYGFCGPSFSHAPAGSVSVGAGDCDGSDAAPACCGAHHCFCCSSTTEVAAFVLTFDACPAPVPLWLQPRPADISVQKTSPPPRI